MHTGQTMITLGALMFLGITVLNMNRSFSDSDVALLHNQYRMEALSLMNTYKEEAFTRFFDEACTSLISAKRVNDFTAAASLGMGVGDGGIPNDFDDYHNYSLTDTGPSGMVYKIFFKVDYVDLSGNQIVTSASRTYHKRMRIYVTDNTAAGDDPMFYHWKNGLKVRDTLSVSLVNSFWFYN